MQRYTQIILMIALFLILIAVASVFIGQGSIGLSYLFHKARCFPPNGEFIQLLLIAVFGGWSARRIIRRFGGK